MSEERATHIADSTPHVAFNAFGWIYIPVPRPVHGEVVWIHDLQAVHREDVLGPLVFQVLQEQGKVV